MQNDDVFKALKKAMISANKAIATAKIAMPIMAVDKDVEKDLLMSINSFGRNGSNINDQMNEIINRNDAKIKGKQRC